ALEFRMEQVEIAAKSSLTGRNLREAALAETTGVLLLAVRSNPHGTFLANPEQDTVLEPHMILIAVGTNAQLNALRRLAEPMKPPHHGR
ncbi:MAG TPA: TrkA C-terminal domain-containing protein, partial [Mycobacterium sp.]|nr:TrkA C-terminal domain-containing protein [Mycobacterium sp.]